MGRGDGFVKWFSELSIKNADIAGLKGASLSEMYNNKFPVPPGFVITKHSYNYFIEKAGIGSIIERILLEVNADEDSSLNKASQKIINLIIESKFPDDLKEQIIEAYDILDVYKNKFVGAAESALDILKNSHEPPFVAVRSSAISEDIENLSFAGQHETFLNVKGNDELISGIKMSFASFFTPRAIYYRRKKLAGTDFSGAVVVQKMIDSQKSGVIFSRSFISSHNSPEDDSILIEAVFGLGSGIALGMMPGDYYTLNKNLEVNDIKISEKRIALTRNSSGRTEIVKLADEISKREVLTGHELKILGQFALRIEELYKSPQNIEFAIDRDGIYILQSVPLIGSRRTMDHELDGNVLFSGMNASHGIGSGAVKIIRENKDLERVQRGNILVLKTGRGDYSVAIQKAAGVIVDGGGFGSQGAIIAREAGVPAVINTITATEKLKDGQIVTVDGFTGRVIEGTGVQRKIEINKVLPTKKTKISLIIDLPDYAIRAVESGIKQAGLVRLESLISSKGKHPVWYIKNDRLSDYVSLIYNGLRKIASHFSDIRIRLTNFKSDEYSNLEGFPERREINPMLGDHGIRFGLKNQDFIEAELSAIKELADKFDGKILGVVFPRVISVKEIKEVKKIAEKIRMPKNVFFGVMIDTPASVQIIDSICEEKIDFVNIDIDELTQYTLAVDRDNEDVRELYDEKNPAVLNSIRHVLSRCKRYGINTFINLSNVDKEVIDFLVKEGIDNISVTADCAYDISKIVSEIEETLKTGATEEKKEDNLKTNEDYVSYEDKILEEFNSNNLEKIDDYDEYSPGIEKEDDVPKLNEAIPVSAEDFVQENDKEINEISRMDIGGDIFEKQQETALETEAEIEKKSSVSNAEALARLFGEEAPKKKEQDEVLDIF